MIISNDNNGLSHTKEELQFLVVAKHMLFELFLEEVAEFISLGNLFQQFLPWNETVFPHIVLFLF